MKGWRMKLLWNDGRALWLNRVPWSIYPPIWFILEQMRKYGADDVEVVEVK